MHVRCLIDEFANIGQIPNFEKLIATIRSREISACIVLQAQSQLKAIYKDHADTIAGNCDSLLFLGGKEKTTLKEMEELLGKETIDTFNTGESRGREISHSLNYQKLGKSLMSVDEIAVMDGSKCILQLRGVRPFLSEKYDITRHPNYKYLSDSNPRNALDIEKYLSRRLKLRLAEEYEAFEVSVSGQARGGRGAFGGMDGSHTATGCRIRRPFIVETEVFYGFFQLCCYGSSDPRDRDRRRFGHLGRDQSARRVWQRQPRRKESGHQAAHGRRRRCPDRHDPGSPALRPVRLMHTNQSFALSRKPGRGLKGGMPA